VREYRAGDKRVTPKGTPLESVYSTSYCSFNLAPKDKERLGQALDRFCNELLPHQGFFHKIRIAGGRVEFFIGWYSEGNTGEVFSSELLKKLSALEADLSLDIYGEDD
jgi:hypothetical protein